MKKTVYFIMLLFVMVLMSSCIYSPYEYYHLIKGKTYTQTSEFSLYLDGDTESTKIHETETFTFNKIGRMSYTCTYDNERYLSEYCVKNLDQTGVYRIMSNQIAIDITDNNAVSDTYSIKFEDEKLIMKSTSYFGLTYTLTEVK